MLFIVLSPSTRAVARRQTTRAAMVPLTRPRISTCWAWIDPVTAPLAIDAGATALVAGTAVFRDGPSAYAANIKALRGGA